MFNDRDELHIRIAWLLLLALAAVAYFPGLSGSFLFDDFPNLRGLGANGGIQGFHDFFAYVFGGFAGPTGRPISLLTFTFDAQSWPADPLPFIKTNIIIHLAVGTALFAFVRSLLKQGHVLEGKQAGYAALACAGVWLLHPYFTSTTLYVVQRMAMLSAFFVIASLWLYLLSRSQLTERPGRAHVLMTLVVSTGTVLATFSKENGAILPVLILCIEITVFAGPGFSKPRKAWFYFFLVFPLLAIVGYLLKIPFSVGWFEDYAQRDFSPIERLMSQSRVVLSYFQDLFLPSFSGGRLFYDDFQISRSLFSPPSTAFAVTIVVSAISFALIRRKTFPLVSFAILFWFASLLIESSTVGIEMKFDHRVYIGSAIVFLPFVVLGVRLLKPKYGAVLAGLVLSILFFATFSAASLWGDKLSMTQVWAAKQPYSVRAQTEAAQALFDAGLVRESASLLDSAAERLVDSFRLRATQFLVKCQIGEATEQTLLAMKELSKEDQYRKGDFRLLENLVGGHRPDCKGLDSRDTVEITRNLIEHTRFQDPRRQEYAQLHYNHGLALLSDGQLDEAKIFLDRALESRSSLHMRMMIAAYLANAGAYEAALGQAYHVGERLESGELTGRELAAAPDLSSVMDFIDVVKQDLNEKLSQD
jgi:tetratricopeptide (TPR) repeat protein